MTDVSFCKFVPKCFIFVPIFVPMYTVNKTFTANLLGNRHKHQIFQQCRVENRTRSRHRLKQAETLIAKTKKGWVHTIVRKKSSRHPTDSTDTSPGAQSPRKFASQLIITLTMGMNICRAGVKVGGLGVTVLLLENVRG